MQAYIIDENGTKTEIVPENGTDFSLQEMYKLLNCDTVEFHRSYNGNYIVVDEEGYPKNLKTNFGATLMWSKGNIADRPLVGKALVCKPSMII